MGDERTPELSIVVPVLNEAAELPALFGTLAEQREVSFELLLCDGGSDDGTVETARLLGGAVSFPCTVVEGERGRGRQMNAGAAIARGRSLLFLHADCRFPDPRALRLGLAALEEGALGGEGVAGRFALRFRRRDMAPSAAYFFYEGKARLDRHGCIHGDQGVLLRRAFFAAVGPFDESLPFLEDDRFAEKVRRSGKWILLPAEIETSARRFETEGLAERQILNALILNFASIGWETPLRALPNLYRRQDRNGRLDLLSFLDEVAGLLAPLSLRRRLVLWYRTGGYVRSNAWQLAFALDRMRHFGREEGFRENRCLDRFDRRIDPLMDNPPGRLAAAVLTWTWFHATRRFLRRRRSLFNPARQER